MAFDRKKAALKAAMKLTSTSYVSGPYILHRPRVPTRQEIFDAICEVLDAYEESIKLDKKP